MTQVPFTVPVTKLIFYSFFEEITEYFYAMGKEMIPSFGVGFFFSWLHGGM